MVSRYRITWRTGGSGQQAPETQQEKVAVPLVTHWTRL